jgi:hypothetical protein
MALWRRSAAIAAATLIGLLAWTASASAATPPQCWNPEIWARPGLTRSFSLYCPGTEHVEVVSEPQRSRFEGLVQGETVKFRLTPDADVPEHDELILRLTGPGGSTDQVIAVTNVPLTQNTAPVCQPASVAQRTNGTSAATVAFAFSCSDEDHDDFTLYGNGPGTFGEVPMHVDGGLSTESGAYLDYTTTTTAGQEQTSFYAVDALGARSADAPVSIEIGPGVDRLPTCAPAFSNYEFFPIFARPGATRRFGLTCEDADGDPFTPRIQTPPTRGDLTMFDPQPPRPGFAGTYQVQVDATYVPRSSFEGDDPFTVVAVGARGDGISRVGIIAQPLPSNGNADCSAGGDVSTPPDTPLEIDAWCEDGEGDPVTTDVTSAPLHGSLGAPTATMDHFGYEHIRVTYSPDPGFVGKDTLSMSIGDEYGQRTAVDYLVSVSNSGSQSQSYAIGTPYEWPELRPVPPAPTWQLAVGQNAPVNPVDQARRVLGTRSVRLVKRIGDARVYANRSALSTAARQPALAVTCPVSCNVTSSSTVAGVAARTANLRISPGKARSLSLELSSAQRRRLRHAGGRASFRLKVTRSRRRAHTGIVHLAFRRSGSA